jgi:hypothetical protein
MSKNMLPQEIFIQFNRDNQIHHADDLAKYVDKATAERIITLLATTAPEEFHWNFSNQGHEDTVYRRKQNRLVVDHPDTIFRNLIYTRH